VGGFEVVTSFCLHRAVAPPPPPSQWAQSPRSREPPRPIFYAKGWGVWRAVAAVVFSV
jgi:hypothetical protein